MLHVDDILPLIGTTLDERVIEGLFRERGHRSSDEVEEGHPEDQRHYYHVPAYGVEMIVGDLDVIDTIFFDFRSQQNGYSWSLRNGLGSTSSRDQVVAALGTPERSGQPGPGSAGCVGFDRFRVGHSLLHFTYGDDCNSVTLITAMLPATAPHGG